MKKICLFALPFLIAISLAAQPVKKDILISFDGNYSKTKSRGKTEQTTFHTVEESLGLSLSVERFFTNNFSVGIGLAHYWDEDAQSDHKLEGNVFTLNYVEIESNYWMPKVFCKYYLPLTKRFYAVPHLTGGFGKAKADVAGGTNTSEKLPDNELVLGDAPSISFIHFESKKDVNLLQVELAPEFVYFFAKRWGATAYLGGLSYNKLSGGMENTDWTFSFKPKYWRLGVNFRF